MLTIIDYSMGNLHSVANALTHLGEEWRISSRPEELDGADGMILPGVGAFPDAVDCLRSRGLFDAIKARALAGTPLLGICLGMQLLFKYGNEHSRRAGLGLIPGEVVPKDGHGEKIPHIGWNAISFKKEHKLFKYIKEGDFVYFVHSYYAADCEDSVIADTEYGARVTAAAASGNIMGCQFHPEKSGNVGLNILRAFCETEN